MQFSCLKINPALVLVLFLKISASLAQNNTVQNNSVPLPGNGNGTGNVVLGPGNSYPSAIDADNNVLIGAGAGVSITTGDNNSFIGYRAGYSNTSGSSNSFVGAFAGTNNTIGMRNSFAGSWAGFKNTEGSNNSFTGVQAGYNNTEGSNNSFTGHQAGYSNTTGGGNSFTGNQAGYSNTTGPYNTYTGTRAGFNNITGIGNSFTGYWAGYSNIAGSENTFTGFQAGNHNNGGSQNTFTGTRAGFNNTDGNDNAFTGHHAGFSNTIGSSNSFAGTQAGYATTTGSFNAFTGFMSGFNNTTGSYNCFFGVYSDGTGPNKAILKRATAIGQNAKVGVDNGLVLGDTTIVKVGIGTAYPNQRFTLRGNMNFVAYDNSLMLKNQPFLHFNEHESLALGLRAKIPAGAEKTLVLGSDETTVQIPGLLGTYQPNAGQFLTVNEQGKVILAQPRVQVAQVADWSDKVFEEGYALRPLGEVEEFVKKNKHLPGVPSAEQMVAEGVESTAFNAKLLEKIEELTLYVVALEKRLKELEKK